MNYFVLSIDHTRDPERHVLCWERDATLEDAIQEADVCNRSQVRHGTAKARYFVVHRDELESYNMNRDGVPYAFVSG